MITYRQLAVAISQLDLDRTKPLIAHASLSSFGQVMGGAETVLGALLAAGNGLMMPAFTYKTMVTPEIGPPDNGIVYGSQNDLNLMAEFFSADLPVDPLIGRVAETLRKQPRAKRSRHPILSFTGIGVDEALEAQTVQNPLAPIEVLMDAGSNILLIGVDHTANTSIHYAEMLAGRKQFVRWALTSQGVVECPGFPGGSEGFDEAGPYLDEITQRVTIGNARIRAFPLAEMVVILKEWITADPLAMLPEDSDDLRVQDARRAVVH